MTTLIAGFGNIFLGDDGFGPAVIEALDFDAFGHDVKIRDFGISGMHLALEMSAGYELVIIVDAVARDDEPGTIFAIEAQSGQGATIDAHDMDVAGVLALYEELCEREKRTQRPRVVVIGCVPESLCEGMGLTGRVRAAIPACIGLVHAFAGAKTPTGAALP